MARTSKKVKLEKTDASSNENSKPSTNVLHVDGKLDGSAAPVIIAGEDGIRQAAGSKFDTHIADTGRLDFSAESVTLAGR